MSGETRLPPPATFRRSERQGGILLAPLATFLAGLKDPSHLIKLAGILERYRTPTSYHRYDFRIVESSDLPPAGSPAEDNEELRRIWTRERGSPLIIDDEEQGIDGEKEEGLSAMDVDGPSAARAGDAVDVGPARNGGGEVARQQSSGAAPETTHEQTAAPQEASNGAQDVRKETEAPKNAIAERHGSAAGLPSRATSTSAPEVNPTGQGASPTTGDAPHDNSGTDHPDVQSGNAVAATAAEAHIAAPSNSRTPAAGTRGTQDERSAQPGTEAPSSQDLSPQPLPSELVDATLEATPTPVVDTEQDADEPMAVDEEIAGGPTASALPDPRNSDLIAPPEATAAPASITLANGAGAEGAAIDGAVITDTNDDASPVANDLASSAALDDIQTENDPPTDNVPPAEDAPADDAPADDAPVDTAQPDDAPPADDNTHAPRSPSPFTPAFPPPPGGTARCNRELRLDLRTLDVAALFQLEVWRREELGLEPLDMLVPASKWYHVEEPPSPPKKKAGRPRKSQAAPNAGTAAEPIVVGSDATPRADGVDTPAAPIDLSVPGDTPLDEPVFGPEPRPATPPPRTPTPDIILPDGFDDDTAADPDFLPPPSLSKPRGRPRGSGRGRGRPRGGRGGRPLDSRPTPEQDDAQTPDLTDAAAAPSGLDDTDAIEVDSTPPPTAQRVDTMHVPIHSSHPTSTGVIEVARPPSVDVMPPALEPDVDMEDAGRGASERDSVETVSDSRGNGKRRRSCHSPRQRAISSGEQSETASAAALDDLMVVDLDDDTSANDTSADAIGPASMSVEARSAPGVAPHAAATSSSSTTTAAATAGADRHRPRRGTFARRAVWRKPERGRGPIEGPGNKVSGDDSNKVGTIGGLRRMRDDPTPSPTPSLFSFTPCAPRQYLECVEIISTTPRRSPSVRALSIVPKSEAVTPRLKSEVVTPRLTRSAVGTPASRSDLGKPAMDTPRATPPASSTRKRAATRARKRPRSEFEDELEPELEPEAAPKVETAATSTLPFPAAHAVADVFDDDDEEWGCLKGL